MARNGCNQEKLWLPSFQAITFKITIDSEQFLIELCIESCVARVSLVMMVIERERAGRRNWFAYCVPSLMVKKKVICSCFARYQSRWIPIAVEMTKFRWTSLSKYLRHYGFIEMKSAVGQLWLIFTFSSFPHLPTSKAHTPTLTHPKLMPKQ